MDLFKLFGSIVVNNAEANAALDETANKAKKTAEGFDDMDESSSKSSGKLKSAFAAVGKGALTVGKWTAAGLGVATTAVAGVTGKALSAAGELQQNMGGSEAVFGKYAEKMQGTASTAFKKMGLSTSNYLATANKMGSLFKGAGFETEEALNLTSSAMQRAADVASIMGIDTEWAMESIAGAAKGNFTMMDNLGVAMNATTIEAYALSKGCTTAYKEMDNQTKIGFAMEMFLEKTAYAAGNYTKENETLTGSLGTAKAALDNFISGAGSVEDVVATFSGAARSIVGQLETMFPSLMNGLTQMVQQIVPLIPPLLQQVLPSLIEGATSLVNGLVAAMPMVLTALMGALPAVISGVTSIFNAIIEALPTLIESICSALPALIPLLIDGLVSMIVTLCSSFAQIIQPLIDNLPEIIISIVTALLANLPTLIDGCVQLILGLVAAMPQITAALIMCIPDVIAAIVQTAVSLIPQLLSAGKDLLLGLLEGMVVMIAQIPSVLASIFKGIVDGIKALFGIHSPSTVMMEIGRFILQGLIDGILSLLSYVATLWNGLMQTTLAIFEAIKNVGVAIWNATKDNIITVITALKNVVTTIWNSIKNIIATVWDGIKNVITTTINAVKNVINSVWNAIKTIITSVMKIISSVIKGDWNGVKTAITSIIKAIKSVISSVWNAIKSVLSSVMTAIKNTVISIWNGIKNTVSSVVNGIKSVISSVWNGIKSTTSSVFNGIKNVTATVWNGVKKAITTPIEAAKDTIGGIVDTIKGFFSGMKISWPDIPMPHFGISPSGWKIGDLLSGSIPKLSIDWYAKAMNNPLLLNDPTIFGYDAASGNLLGGGEAGAEVVAGANTLMGMIGNAVAANSAAQSERIVAVLAAILEAITGGNQEVVRALLAGQKIAVDGREFGRLVKQYA